MSNFIFVYGTLRKGQNAYSRFGLETSAKFIKTATIQGLMYSMGGYPGIKLLEGNSQFVLGPEDPVIIGDLLEINEEVFETTIRRLDNYEGCDSRNSDNGLYRRVQAETTCGFHTWIYEINGPQNPNRLIKSGNWIEYCQGIDRRYA